MGLLRTMTMYLNHLLAGGYTWPALDISLPHKRHFHLVGSIHMGTRDMAPLPARLREKLRHCDALIVEADITQGDSPFGPEAARPPLHERLSDDQWQHLSRLTDELEIPLYTIDTLPAWRVALILQIWQARQLGLHPEYGIDHQLITAAHELGVPVQELEGADSQVTLLTTLEDDGMDLLADTLTHWHTNARLMQLMVSWWLESPPKENHVALPNTFGETLYDVLMLQRNQAWRQYLTALPAGRYMVAVGALHLYGEGNLPGLLAR
ncbi:conjugal transfer protein TraB [Shimwellia pseudoproteus]|uniref:TraB/GumN family protein n=1 Tax=Shimwellia pseudoproteus TaxID=570012 RepID=UPI0018EDF963|nr:TraB/GumN family protein [Shimwellia pseudoproteus]MBJ3814632.1 conjugal transfer protein TraB [Shimwellia pseudoproteus]